MLDARRTHQPVPPRARLSCLEPLGVGTPDCESLQGYVGRLAAVHRVSVADLIELVRGLPQFDGERYELSVGRKLYRGRTPGLFAVRLARLTGVPKVGAIGMPWADHTITIRNHVRWAPVWCSECWREDDLEGRPRYHRLLWSLNIHSRCQRHRTPLASTCSSCGSSAQGDAMALPDAGGCRQCGADLLDSRNGVGSQSAVDTHPPGPGTHLEDLFAELVAEMPRLGEAARLPDLERAIGLIKSKANVDLQKEVLRVACLAPCHFIQLQRSANKRNPTSILAIIKLAAAAGVRISDLLRLGSRPREFPW